MRVASSRRGAKPLKTISKRIRRIEMFSYLIKVIMIKPHHVMFHPLQELNPELTTSGNHYAVN